MDDKKIIQYSNNLIIRKSEVVLLMRIVVFELLAGLLYILLRIGLRLVDIQLDTDFSLDPVSLLKSLIFVALEIAVVGLAIIQWIRNYYILTPFEIKYVTGILSKKETSYSIKNLQSVSYEQGLIGRVFNYGNVKAFSPALQKELILTEISSPHLVAENVKDVLEESGSKSQFIMRRS